MSDLKRGINSSTVEVPFKGVAGGTLISYLDTHRTEIGIDPLGCQSDCSPGRQLPEMILGGTEPNPGREVGVWHY